MVEKTIKVINQTGLHARPAAMFVRLAARYPCDVFIQKDDREASAKSVIGVLSLGVRQGSVITVRTSGRQEAEALNVLTKLIEDGFGETD